MIAAPEERPAVTNSDAAPPPVSATVRGERLFARIDRAFAWLDGFLARWLPHEVNPLAHPGAAANFALCAAVVSGVALLIWYSPSLQFAYPSVVAMSAGTLGGWVRAVHRYSSDLAMVFVLLHAGRVFFARKFAGNRWLPWVSGIGLIGLVWFIGWTGYWLVWDQPAQQVAVTSMKLLDGLPIFGEPLGRLYVADRTVPSLLFFVVFFLHMLLPLGIAVGLAVHLVRVSRARLFPSWRTSLALTAGLTAAALLVPAPLDAPAQMAVKAASFTVDAWYLAPLALAMRLQHAGLWLALFGGTAIAALIPWLLGRRRRAETYQTRVEQSRCHACTQCMQDCPFDAITMIARTDGKPFPSQAHVDPAKCVGCAVCAGSCDSEAMSLPWFDTRREEARIASESAATREAGGPAAIAFVAGDIDSAIGLFLASSWRQRLPGYQVHVVPTASWVRPKLIEHLLQHGASGVLIVRDARTEAAARDGNRWVEARLAGVRKPAFRPERAGGSSRWLVVDYDPARPAELQRAAAKFLTGEAVPRPVARHRKFGLGLVSVGLALVLGAATILPSGLRVTNPAPANPEFVLSFKALGERVTAGVVDAAADAGKPIHMRGRATEKPHRAPVVVRLTIDGRLQERTYRAKGISQDGPAIDEWREPLATGPRLIAVEIATGPGTPPARWSGTIEARDRCLHVVTFEPDAGFRLEGGH